MLTGSWLPQFRVHLSLWAPSVLPGVLAAYLCPGGTVTPEAVVSAVKCCEVCRIYDNV